jgi:1-acyl-sn-glycerol-3-phosphate acyltransferase
VQPGSEDLTERVAAVAASVTGTRVDDPDTPLELGPLGRTEFALALEETFGISLEDSRGLRTVAEAASTVAAQKGRPSVALSLHPATGRLQGIVRSLCESAFRWYFHLTVTGAERFPSSGPVVLAANHESMWDIPLLVAASPRPIVFMAEEAVFGSLAASWFFTRLGSFPVRRRTGDLRAIRAALAVVRSNRVLGIYPEGTRRRGVLLPFRPGASWIALASGAALVPVGIAGTGEVISKGTWVPRRARVHIAFGEPVTELREPDPHRRLDQASDLTDRLRSEVGRLIRK